MTCKLWKFYFSSQSYFLSKGCIMQWPEVYRIIQKSQEICAKKGKFKGKTHMQWSISFHSKIVEKCPQTGRLFQICFPENCKFQQVRSGHHFLYCSMNWHISGSHNPHCLGLVNLFMALTKPQSQLQIKQEKRNMQTKQKKNTDTRCY